MSYLSDSQKFNLQYRLALVLARPDNTDDILSHELTAEIPDSFVPNELIKQIAALIEETYVQVTANKDNSINLKALCSSNAGTFSDQKPQFCDLAKLVCACVSANERLLDEARLQLRLAKWLNGISFQDAPQDPLISMRAALDNHQNIKQWWLTDVDLRQLFVHFQLNIVDIPIGIRVLNTPQDLHCGLVDLRRQISDPKKPYSLGFILNSNLQKGIHWTYVIIDINEQDPNCTKLSIYYRDSFNLNPASKKKVLEAIEAAFNIVEDGNTLWPHYEIIQSDINGTGQQKDGFRCGYLAFYGLVKTLLEQNKLPSSEALTDFTSLSSPQAIQSAIQKILIGDFAQQTASPPASPAQKHKSPATKPGSPVSSSTPIFPKSPFPPPVSYAWWLLVPALTTLLSFGIGLGIGAVFGLTGLLVGAGLGLFVGLALGIGIMAMAEIASYFVGAFNPMVHDTAEKTSMSSSVIQSLYDKVPAPHSQKAEDKAQPSSPPSSANEITSDSYDPRFMSDTGLRRRKPSEPPTIKDAFRP